MRSLFLVNTVYQLMMAVNMRVHGIPEGAVDIAVSDHTPSLRDRVRGLERAGIHNKVFYLQSGAFNDHYWGITRAERGRLFLTPKRAIADTERASGIDFSSYDRIYCANLDAFTRHVHRAYPEVAIHCFEDGAGVCVTDFNPSGPPLFPHYNDIEKSIRELWLYQPEAMQSDVHFPMRKLPDINRNSTELVRVIDTVFEMGDPGFRFAPYVYVDQSYQADRIRNNSMRFVEATSRIVGYDNLQIKGHPRNPAPKALRLGYGQSLDFDVPFELLYLKLPVEDTTFITVSSGSLLSPYAVFGERPRTVFLYDAISGPINLPRINARFVDYMHDFTRIYGGENLVVPESLTEYVYYLRSSVSSGAGRRV